MLDRMGSERAAYTVEYGLPLFLFTGEELDLYEFVTFEGAVDFIENGTGQAVLADDDDRIARMGFPAEKTLLGRTEHAVSKIVDFNP